MFLLNAFESLISGLNTYWTRLVPSRYLNFNFIGTNRYISISIYIDQYQRWTRARGKGKAREKLTTGRLQRQNGGQFYNKT